MAGRAAALRLLQSREAEDHRRPVGRGDLLAPGRTPVRPAVLRRARDTRSRRPGPAAHGPGRIRPGPPRPRRTGSPGRAHGAPRPLRPKKDPPPPPVHRHSGWWPDPRAGEIAFYLVDLLDRTSPPGPPPTPAAPDREEPAPELSPRRPPAAMRDAE